MRSSGIRTIDEKNQKNITFVVRYPLIIILLYFFIYENLKCVTVKVQKIQPKKHAQIMLSRKVLNISWFCCLRHSTGSTCHNSFNYCLGPILSDVPRPPAALEPAGLANATAFTCKLTASLLDSLNLLCTIYILLFYSFQIFNPVVLGTISFWLTVTKLSI